MNTKAQAAQKEVYWFERKQTFLHCPELALIVAPAALAVTFNAAFAVAVPLLLDDIFLSEIHAYFISITITWFHFSRSLPANAKMM